MSITETPTVPAKRKYAPRRKKAKPTPAPVKPSPYLGMSNVKCGDGCRPECCVVSEQSYCAHPRKGALQSGQMHDRKAIARLADAKEHIARSGG